MTEELKQAKEKVKMEVDYALAQVEEMTQKNNLEPSWVLEEFRNQVISKVNRRINN